MNIPKRLQKSLALLLTFTLVFGVVGWNAFADAEEPLGPVAAALSAEDEEAAPVPEPAEEMVPDEALAEDATDVSEPAAEEAASEETEGLEEAVSDETDLIEPGAEPDAEPVAEDDSSDDEDRPADTVLMSAPAMAPSRDGGTPKEVPATVTNLTIQNLSGATATEMWVTDQFYLAMDWDASQNGADLHEGDYFDITLPDQMRFPPDSVACDFNLYGPDGTTVIATAHVDPGTTGGTVRITFTDWVEGKENVKGNIRLAARFDQTQVTVGEENTFQIQVGSEVVPVTVTVTGPTELQDEILGKWGQGVDGAGGVLIPDLAEWHVRINHMKATRTNVVITDHLSEGTGNETYIADSFLLRRVEMSPTGGTVSTYETMNLVNGTTVTGDKGSFTLNIAADGRSFTLDMGDIDGDQYRLSYRTTYAPGTKLRNNMTLTSVEQTKTYSASHQSASSGGQGTGDLANKIKIVKVDTDGVTPLAGAEFEVTRPDGTTFPLTTGADGTVTSGTLTSGTYKVREKTPPVGYVADGDEHTLVVSSEAGAILTVTNEPIKISVSVTKVWVGPEGGPVTVKLLADGAEVPGRTVTLSADSDWSGEFSGLRQYNINGTEIAYTVEEIDIDNYSSEVSGDAENGFTVTNTNTETVSIPVTKKWVGPTGSEVTIGLLADGAEVPGRTVTLSVDGGWTGSFDGLPRYNADGSEIAYTVTEAQVSGVDPDKYGTAVTGNAADGFTVTNTNKETVEVPVAKVWVGPAGSAVTVKLLADGQPTGQELTLDGGNGWAGSFDGLPKYNADGSEIAYTVAEAQVSGVDPDKYDTTVTGSADTGFTITNANTETVDISGTKTWDDAGDQDGVRPPSITVRLLADGAEVGSKPVTEADGWAFSFSGLPKYDTGDGHEIAYTVTEDAVDNYATSIAGTAITNSYTPGKTSVTVTKAWDDANDQDGKRPEIIQVQLYADGQPSGGPVELSDGNQWSHTWTELDQKTNGRDIVYTVGEVEVPEGYTAVISGDATGGYTVTNSYTPETTSVPVTKVWVGPEGGSVTVRLLADGVDTGKTLTLSAGNGWSDSFDGLPKYADGAEIAYTVTEDPVENHSAEITGDAASGFTIANTNTETVDIPVIKKWVGAPAAGATVQLKADGKVIAEVTLTASSKWTHTFAGLPKYDAATGEEIVYTLTETSIPGYGTKITGDATHGFTVTNTREVPPGVPKTGDGLNPLRWSAFALAGSSLMLAVAAMRLRSWRKGV